MKIEWDKVAGRTYFIVGILALVVVPAALAYMGLGVIGLLMALPIFAWIAARLFVHGGGVALTWFSRAPLEKWQGVYYAFNDVQVRVYEDGGELWFVTGDVLKAVGMKSIPAAFRAAHPSDMRTVEGTRLTALNPAGLEHLLARRNEHDAARFLLWMRREVVAPWEKKR